MHSTVWMLLLAAAGVAILHAILPDHWVPLAVIGRAERWSLPRTGKIAAWTGVGHVAGSLALGVILILVGLGIGSIIRAEGWIVGVILIATGIGFYLWGRFRGSIHSHDHEHHHHHGTVAAHDHDDADDGHDKHHDEKDEEHEHGGHGHEHHYHHKPNRGVSWLIPAGIAASPDPTILPIFLAAATLGIIPAIEVVVLYSLVTIASITLLTVLATAGGYQVEWPWLEASAEKVTALVLILMGVAAIVAF